jgi:hypothetical protein
VIDPQDCNAPQSFRVETLRRNPLIFYADSPVFASFSPVPALPFP